MMVEDMSAHTFDAHARFFLTDMEIQFAHVAIGHLVAHAVDQLLLLLGREIMNQAAAEQHHAGITEVDCGGNGNG